jgi:hypothetical protein
MLTIWTHLEKTTIILHQDAMLRLSIRQVISFTVEMFKNHFPIILHHLTDSSNQSPSIYLRSIFASNIIHNFYSVYSHLHFSEIHPPTRDNKFPTLLKLNVLIYVLKKPS